MSINTPFSLLRKLLLVDAIACAVMGAALVLGSGGLAALTAVPPVLLLYAGAALFPVAAFMALTATRALEQRPAVWVVILGNLLWAAASLALLACAWIEPNLLGQFLIAAQAVAVFLLAALEYAALRRSWSAAVV